MNKIYETASDLHVKATMAYVKTSDTYAYADSTFKTKISAADLYNMFVMGMLIVDAAGVQYKPISCKTEASVVTVTYVTTDTNTATTAKLATLKSS